MKTCSTNPLLVSVVVAGLELVLTGQLAAQTFTTLYNFKPPSYVGLLNLGYYTNDGGAEPLAALILSSNTLFGTADFGGRLGGGTVFAVKIDGTSFTTLHEFNSSDVRGSGGSPQSALTLSNDTLYGTGEFGFVFAINSDGTGFTTLHTFSDGSHPFVGLILSGNTLYGTAVDGGNSHNGTIFAVNTDGTGFTTLHDFTALTAYSYGGGDFGNGTVFAVKTDGTGFTTLHSFTASYTNSDGTYTNSDGADPVGGLLLSGYTLYGTTVYGGISGEGTIFSISFQPQLTINAPGTDVVVTWPTNYAGFDYSGFTLQSTTNLESPVWTTNFPAPFVVNGQNTVTNPIFGTQQFFRLSQ